MNGGSRFPRDDDLRYQVRLDRVDAESALADSGEAAPRLATLSSTTFDAQLGVAAKVAAENPDLYFEIQHLNDYGTESLSALLYAVERLRSVVRANDLDGFRALMNRGRAYLKDRAKR